MNRTLSITAIVSCLSVLNAGAQTELIPNWRIEDPASNGNPNPPCNEGNQVYRAVPWGGIAQSSNGDFSGPRLFDTRGSVINSVDYCPIEGPVVPSAPSNSWGDQTPHSGNRYLGIACGMSFTEIEYVYVALNEPVYYGDELDLSLFVSQADNMEPLGFKVRLSGDTDWENSDPTIYEGVASNPYDWVEHTAEVTVAIPADEEDVCGPWNYLLIRGNPNSSLSGLFLDDVSLKKTYNCYTDHDCVPRSGPSNLLFSMPHNADFPFCAIGAENLSFIRMEIWTGNGSELIWDFEMEYPPNRICWDGRNANWWPVANATYEYRVHTESFCSCSKDYVDHFLKFSHGSWDPSYEYYDDYYFNLPASGCPRPSFCCGDIDHSLNVFSCDIDGEREYKVQNEIHVEHSVVKQNANVSMWAGNRIELTEFSTETDSRFVAEIVPCPVYRLGEEFTEEDVVLDESIERGVNEDFFNVYPNPNNGSFTISANEIGTVYISDVAGKLIETINGGLRNKVKVDGLSSGLYIIRVQMVDGSVENAKVVVN
ncbi:MAG: hypothetical protein ACI9LA_000003 [Bacteroidia bacterium]|jgi:hypothetical protein